MCTGWAMPPISRFKMIVTKLLLDASRRIGTVGEEQTSRLQQCPSLRPFRRINLLWCLSSSKDVKVREPRDALQPRRINKLPISTYTSRRTISLMPQIRKKTKSKEQALTQRHSQPFGSHNPSTILPTSRPPLLSYFTPAHCRISPPAYATSAAYQSFSFRRPMSLVRLIISSVKSISCGASAASTSGVALEVLVVSV